MVEGDLQMKNKENINQLSNAFMAYGKAISDYDDRIIQFILENVEPNKFQFLANQCCGFEDLTHNPLTIESIQKILDYKEQC